MRGSNIISAIHSLKIAQEHFEDFRRDYPTSTGSKLFKIYIRKIQWIFSDFLAHPHLEDDVRQGIKEEINSDIFSVPAITEKISLLNPNQREMIESLIDSALEGKEFEIINK